MSQEPDPIHLENRDAMGERLYSPSAGRNKDAIGEILENRLPRGARILEIAGGTGEHAAHISGLREDIIWQPSDPDAASRASQNAWAADRPGQILPSLAIDTTEQDWWAELPGFDAMYCANMIHIAPWEAANGMIRGASHLVKPGGQFFLYGPFLNGEASADSNLKFNETLKSRNPTWGVRDQDSVKHIFADAGFNMSARIDMPRDNHLLIFLRRP